MSGLKKVNVVKTTLSDTPVVYGCPCDGACWAGTSPKDVKNSWFATSKKVSVTKTVSPAV